MGLSLEDPVPDATTLGLFRQQLTDSGKVTELFEQFESYLQTQGYTAQGGQIVDATLVPVPKQRNKRSENDQIHQGEVPEDCPVSWLKKTWKPVGQRRMGSASMATKIMSELMSLMASFDSMTSQLPRFMTPK